VKACVMEMFTLVPPLEPGQLGDVGIVAEDSIVREVAAKRVVTLGGLPAVLLQLAHPMVAQGVSDYSRFQHDPLARLISTLDATLVMTFGDTCQVAEKVGKVRLRHQAVHGELGQTHGEWRQGELYSALDAKLCLWVYATGVEMVLDTYSALYAPLSQPARAKYYADGKPLAEAMGVARSVLPATYSEFRSYYQDMLGRLVVGQVARDIAAAIFAAKLGPVPVSPLGPVIAAALLPADRIRSAYGLKWGWREQAIWHVFRIAAGAAVRIAPPQVNEWPHARVARLRGAGKAPNRPGRRAASRQPPVSRQRSR
jgi:uncharacterized protein (DUF2236 family)